METRKIVVKGLVQGIGFRPFVARQAEELRLTGWVRNTKGIVTVLATGEGQQMEELIRRMEQQPPEGARVEKIDTEELPLQPFVQFSIIESRKEPEADRGGLPVLPADLPTCGRCAREMKDPANRRYRYPFISCTACGPRYSILEEIPYDREHISMKKYPMCPACAEEYRSPGNMRRHAQTIACKDCGPRLVFEEIPGDSGQSQPPQQSGAALSAAIRHLQNGGILAVKDIGGYHLAAAPFSPETVQQLRRIKGREKKPFAVMFPDTASVREFCRMDPAEEELLCSPPRPIVLLRKRPEGKHFCEEVCGSSPDVGAMLPCNPVQILLTEAVGPLIMTSANLSGGLLFTEEEPMRRWLEQAFQGIEPDGKPVRLGMLSHDRPIETPLDDSVLRLVCGKQQTLRRGRGMVPEPIPFPSNRALLAGGGDLKACFCYTGEGKAYLSQHLGDLFEESCFAAYQKELVRMKRLFGFAPEQTVCDRHPGYRSAGYYQGEAQRNRQKPPVQIQHHKAHVASVIAEHDLKGKVTGFAFDGTGFGDDGTIWGSEVFLWDGKTMERRAHLKPVRLMGGDEGAKNADTILYGYLASLPEETERALTQQISFSTERYGIVKKAIGLGVNCVQSTSMGRLFDAVSAGLGICHYNSYEGEAAIELENCAATTEEVVPLSFGFQNEPATGQLLLDADPLFRGIAEALAGKKPIPAIARGFLFALAQAIAEISKQMGNRQIALSGGTFLNRILLEQVNVRLEEQGYEVYRNEQIPPGDGGLCLGQAYLAAK
jgi:hydrogenase maturation protein HypF